MAFGWLKKAVRSAGKVVTKPVKLVAKAGRTVGRQLGKVPVVGGGLKGVFDLTVNAPFQVAGKVASGERIDRVAISSLKAHVSSVKDVAPYAQTVISIVPVVGPGVNAGIGAGLALASGQPITTALMEGVKSALPGGPLARSVFEASSAVIQGKPIDQIILSTIPLDAQAKKGLAVALDVSKRLASGQRVDKVLLSQADRALILLPSDVQKSFKVGTAMAEARKLQAIAAKHVDPKALTALKNGGANLIKSSPLLSSASAVLRTQGAKTGYSVAMGVMQHQNPQPFHVAAIRRRLDAEQRKGFDLAVSVRSGMVASRLGAPKSAPPSQQLGYYATRGIVKTANTPAIIKAVRTNPATKAGASAAIAKIQAVKPGLWKRIKVFFVGD
jgi:hypothetical protein